MKQKKIFGILVFMLLITSISVNSSNASVENINPEQKNNSIEQSYTASHSSIIDPKKVKDDDGVAPLSSPPEPMWFNFYDDEWNFLVQSPDWGNIGKANQQIFLKKLKYDCSEIYDFYSVKWDIQSVPGCVLWGNDWRTDKINNWANCDDFDSYVKLVKYGPYGDHGSTTVGVNIGVSAGTSGAAVSCGLSWSYIQEDFMQFDYSDFSDELVSWLHDDMNDDLMQTIMVEPGFTIRVPQSEDWTIHFFTKVKYRDPDFFWNRYCTVDLTWEWTNLDHNFAPDTPDKPSGTAGGKKGKDYSFSTGSYDPDGGDLLYEFDWDDGTTSQTSWYDSGEIIAASHNWTETGTYEIRVRAQDKEGEWSGQSHIHAVTITPKSRERTINVYLTEFIQKMLPILQSLLNLL